MGQLQLTLFRFFSQDVTLESVLSLDFTRTGKLEPLFGTGFGFHLGHFPSF